MLRSIGFEANPMLIASKEQGWVLYPSYNAFDVVICALEINNKIYLLDASKKNGGFGEIPLEYNNGKGLIMFDDGYSLNFPTMIKEKSKNSVLVGTVIDVKNLKITGNIDKQITKYFAWEFRDLFENTKDEDYIDFLERNTLLKISNLEKTDFENFNKPIKISFNFEYEDYIEKIDDKLYFGPLLYFKKEENDFNEENRLYPIDLNFPYSEKFIINYNIPEGYKVESLPLNKRYIIADNIGELIFHIKASDKNIQVSLKVLINHAVIPAFYYKQLNILFNEYSIISKSKIVLSKI